MRTSSITTALVLAFALAGCQGPSPCGAACADPATEANTLGSTGRVSRVGLDPKRPQPTLTSASFSRARAAVRRPVLPLRND